MEFRPSPAPASHELVTAAPEAPPASFPDRDAPRRCRVRDGAADRPHRRPIHPRTLKALVALADSATIAMSLVIAFLLAGRPVGVTRPTLLVGALSLPLWVSVLARYHLFHARYVASWLEESGRLVHALLAGTLLMAAVAFATKQPVSRLWLGLCYPTALACCIVEREIVRAWFNRLRQSGRSVRPVVLVGANAEAEVILTTLATTPGLGYRVVAVTDDTAEDLLGRPVDASVPNTLDVVRMTRASGVIVVTTALSSLDANRLVRELVDANVRVEMSSSLQGIDAERLTVRPLDMLPIVYIEPVRLGGWRAVAKRAFDVAFAALALLLLAPILALVAIAIKIDSRGPVLFSQVRVGRSREPFRIFKLRTMVRDAEGLLPELQDRNECDGPLFKLHDDPRVTWLGRFLRRYSIDEVPQLWNVLRGDMSIVGPRPALFSEMEAWPPEIGLRLRVRPGLTGMWQVSGRSDASFSEYARLDVYYVENWSLWRDLAIVAKTVPVVFRRSGAY